MKYLICLLALAGAPAVAQTCVPHSHAVQYLAENYSESRQVIAITNGGDIFEVFASESGTWSILISSPNGCTELVLAGDAYDYQNEPLPPMGEEG